MTPPPDRPTASILIPTWRAPSYLDVTLQTVMPQAREAGAEVIVVSDGPDPETARVTERHAARLVTLPQRGAQLGAQRRHRGGALGSARVHRPGRGRTRRVAGRAARRVRCPPGTRGVRRPDPRPPGGRAAGRAAGSRPPSPPSTLGSADRDVSLVWGANMAMRRSAFDKVGAVRQSSCSAAATRRNGSCAGRQPVARIRYLAAAGIDHRRAAGRLSAARARPCRLRAGA